MTDEQFDLLTRLLRMTSQPIITAAKLVLVKGERQANAARETGCRPNHLSRAIDQIKVLHDEIRSVYT